MAQVYRNAYDAKAAASKLFEKALYLGITNKGLLMEDIAGFDILPIVVASNGLGLDKLIDAQLKMLDPEKSNLTDLSVYHTLKGIALLGRMGFVYSSNAGTKDHTVSPTAKATVLFELMQSTERTEEWLAECRSSAQAGGVDMYRFDLNAEKVRKLIAGMVSSKDSALKGAARQ